MTSLNQPNFDRVVPIYDFFKSLLFWGAIQRCQYYHLSHLKDCKNILIIGGGTGKIIGAIRDYCEFDSILYVDSSEQMLTRARRFIKKNHAELEKVIEFQAADILNLPLNTTFDAIVMPFVADCFSNAQLDEIGKKLNNTLALHGLLLLSDFYESEHSRFANTLSRFISVPIYLVLNVFCNLNIIRLPNFNTLLNPMVLEKRGEQLFFAGVLRSVVYAKVRTTESR